MFGLHSNAEINYLTNQCETIFRQITDIQGGGTKKGGDSSSNVNDLVKTYQEQLPEKFDILKLAENIATKSEGNPSPYDIFCQQECEKMNNLLQDIFSSLEELFMGLDGALNMSDTMETLSQSLTLNRIP